MEKLTLIEGQFSPEDAKEVLLNVLRTKIDFHNIKNMSHLERFGQQDELSARRIPELRKSIEKCISIISECAEKNGTLVIHSEIKIEIKS